MSTSSSRAATGAPSAFWSQRIAGMNIPLYLVLLTIILAAIYADTLPSNIVSGLAVAMLLGAGLKWAGDQIPLVKSVGGGALLCIIIPSVAVYLGLFPESFAELADAFYNEYGFAELAVSGLIVGSILGMNRELLVKAGIKFFIPLLTGLLLALGASALVGWLSGFGATEALFYIAAPVMGGGMAAGAVPMSEIYAQAAGDGNAGEHLAQIAPIVGVANVICILLAGALNGLGNHRRFRGLSGDGRMLRRGVDFSADNDPNRPSLTASSLVTGVAIAIVIYVFGQLLYALVPSVHAYVWIILTAALLRIFNLVPAFVSYGAEDWYTFISKAWIPAVLVAISAGMIDLNDVIAVVTSPGHLGLTVFAVLCAAVMAGLIGMLVGFYFIEISVSAGLGMADMGGSGDVAVLGAANRIGLFPFLQIASRVGGAATLLVVSLLASWLM